MSSIVCKANTLLIKYFNHLCLWRREVKGLLQLCPYSLKGKKKNPYTHSTYTLKSHLVLLSLMDMLMELGACWAKVSGNSYFRSAIKTPELFTGEGNVKLKCISRKLTTKVPGFGTQSRGKQPTDWAVCSLQPLQCRLVIPLQAGTAAAGPWLLLNWLLTLQQKALRKTLLHHALQGSLKNLRCILQTNTLFCRDRKRVWGKRNLRTSPWKVLVNRSHSSSTLFHSLRNTKLF